MLPTSYYVLDVETTGRDPNNCGIVEIAVLPVIDGVLQEDSAWRTFVNPGIPCSDEARAVHGISDEFINSAPAEADVMRELLMLLDDDMPVVAHNAERFDRFVVEAAARRAGLPRPAWKWVDTLPIARRALPGGLHSLLVLAGRLDVQPDTAHRALGDCVTLARIVEAMRNLQTAPVRAPPAPVAPPSGMRSTQLAAPTPAPAPADIVITVADNADPLVKAAASKLTTIAYNIAKHIGDADLLVCDTDDDERVVVDAIATLKRIDRDAVRERTKLTGDLNAIKRDIEALWRQFALQPVAEAIKRLEDLRRPLALARAKAAAAERAAAEQRAAELAERERQVALQQAAAASGPDAELDALFGAPPPADAVADANDRADEVYEAALQQSAAIAPAPTVGSVATARDKIVWKVRVVSPRQVPAHLCSPDVDKIRAWIEQHNGDVRIPGVEFEADVVTSTRARRG